MSDLLLANPAPDDEHLRAAPVPEGEQVQAIRDMTEWWLRVRKGAKGADQIFYLAGFAGTGKTFLVKHLMKEQGLKAHQVRLMTFMGRSARVLSVATGLPATTIHSQIYKPDDNAPGGWFLDTDSDIRNAKLLILDECQTIGEKMITDLRSFNRPILVLGDPEQLEPVKDAPFFQLLKPNVFLTEIRRQALENPIIGISKAIREGSPIGYGDWSTDLPDGRHVQVRKLTAAQLSPEEWVNASICLTFSQQRRAALNQTYRQFLGFGDQSPYPRAGERIVCRRNRSSIGVTNGMLGTMLRDSSEPQDMAVFIDAQFEDLPAVTDLSTLSTEWVPTFNDRGKRNNEAPEFLKRKHIPVEYGYCITGHMALGSQFDSVIVVDCGRQYDARKWMYTAVTRAVANLNIVTV
jgi:exodeoxyribonuclease-5